jgi:hypothetical protein
MIIIPRQGDNYRDIIDWLTEHVAPNSKSGYEPVWGSPHSQKVEWRADNYKWRIVLDDRAKELSISVMDAKAENVLRAILQEKG